MYVSVLVDLTYQLAELADFSSAALGEGQYNHVS